MSDDPRQIASHIDRSASTTHLHIEQLKQDGRLLQVDRIPRTLRAVI